jgi:PleD family two-component response regulator
MVDQIEPTSYIPPPAAPAGGQSGFAGRHPQEENHTTPREPAVDVAAVLGATEQALSPAMQQCFLELVGHVEKLREELERVRMHETYLVNAADKHPSLPALNRRAFYSGLSRLLQTSERAELPGSLALLHVSGIEAIRETHGLAAAEAALIFVTGEIMTELRQTDLLGYLDSSDFGVALAVAEPEGARDKIDRIVATLSATPFLWQEQALGMRVASGIVHFEKGMTAESAMAQADQAMMSGTREFSSIAM